MTSAEVPVLRYWNDWNAEYREHGQDWAAQRQAEIFEAWLGGIGRRDLRILEVGCGAGWLSRRLGAFGHVTGIDLADEVVARARERQPGARLLAGDFMTTDVGGPFDVVVHMETLAHVVDQQAFCDRVADLLAPGGRLMVSTQNRTVRERYMITPPAPPAQIRHWVDPDRLRYLVGARLVVDELFTVNPDSDRLPRRLLTARRVHRLLGHSLSQRLERRTEAWGWGRTIMLRAHRE
ncbi:methyltransferase family protein [Mumia flava]|uniref:Methyltransferase family protein n=1 Tax=Mumia flava TaxID=1348852 RepID=A0A0B2B1C4_9ACTN|nr:methyltransferase domain-containing protein [Mumia flava]PJJ56876.1 methyltransferase family protein [Mumia flava]